jgi:hypothetical protein
MLMLAFGLACRRLELFGAQAHRHGLGEDKY